MHRYDVWFGLDGDYVVWHKFEHGYWIAHAWWLIPGTQVEDE